MNWDQVQGKWKQYKGNMRQKWGKLTDDDFDVINGQREVLVGKIQERYGTAKDVAEKQVDEFVNSLGSSSPESERAAKKAGHSS